MGNSYLSIQSEPKYVVSAFVYDLLIANNVS